MISQKLDEEVKIKSHVYNTDMKKQDGTYGNYWFIQFTNKDDVEKFFQYLDKADKKLLDVAKKEFSHKFGP